MLKCQQKFVGILTFISMINTSLDSLKARKVCIFLHFCFYEQLFLCSIELTGFSIIFFARGQTPVLGSQILSFCIDFILVRTFEAA